MTPYGNRSRQSGVVGYEIGTDRIWVQFSSGRICLYTYNSAGRQAIEKMKVLAVAGEGLSGYISQEKPGYET